VLQAALNHKDLFEGFLSARFEDEQERYEEECKVAHFTQRNLS